MDGLTEDQVDDRLREFGPNEVVHEKAPVWYIQLLQAFVNPFIAVLFILVVISLITDVILPHMHHEEEDYTTVAVISTMVLLSVLLRFIQEFRSNQAAEKLKVDGKNHGHYCAVGRQSRIRHQTDRSR